MCERNIVKNRYLNFRRISYIGILYYIIIMERNIETSLVSMSCHAIPKIQYFLFITNKATNIWMLYFILNFMFKPCIDMTSLNNNQLMQSQFNIY